MRNLKFIQSLVAGGNFGSIVFHDEFKESEHPRAANGEFGSGGGSIGSSQPKTEAGLFVSTGNRETDRKTVQSKAEELAERFRKAGISVNIEHSGSAAGPSSYIHLPFPGFPDIRLSTHSKGAFNSQFVRNVASAEDFDRVLKNAKELQDKYSAYSNSPEALKATEAAEEQAHQIRLKNAAKKLKKGIALSNAEKEALEIEDRHNGGHQVKDEG